MYWNFSSLFVILEYLGVSGSSASVSHVVRMPLGIDLNSYTELEVSRVQMPTNPHSLTGAIPKSWQYIVLIVLGLTFWSTFGAFGERFGKAAQSPPHQRNRKGDDDRQAGFALSDSTK